MSKRAMPIVFGLLLLGVLVGLTRSGDDFKNPQVARRTHAANEIMKSMFELEAATAPGASADQQSFLELVQLQARYLLNTYQETGAVLVEIRKERERWNVWEERKTRDLSMLMIRMYYLEKSGVLAKIDYYSNGKPEFSNPAYYVPLTDEYFSAGDIGKR